MTEQNAAILDKETLNNLDAESLLSLDISQLSDVEAYVPLPTALYRFQVKEFELDTVGGDNKTAIKMGVTVTECVELQDEAEAEEVGELPKDYMEMFVLEGTKGFAARKFATIFREIAATNGVSTMMEIMESAQGASGTILIKRRSYKNKETGETRVSNEMQADTIQWD